MIYFGYINVPYETQNQFFVIKADTSSNKWEIELWCGDNENKASEIAIQLDNEQIGLDRERRLKLDDQ